ncbi:DUF72 domain-containing protein [Burkholderia glumae]|uniref:DUF72 domain-containing protein n=1 Tax=Burkholderia glumae TaxID=337 RepID=UPI0005C28AE9|nr:DUF72 domain-containing protein [Burkholderia glumae]MCM2492829.1 DUF72 domain-containing protein [Burkholderia glumae]MCM2544483.1 DUF72 domain-containing protein [Burkholderia glumae]
MTAGPPAESRSRPGPIYVGSAGWALSSRVADSFLTEGSHLERYARVFSAVEINSSFYRPHQPRTYARWAASVPEAFRFSVKMPRRISHELRLRDADADVSEFLAQIAPLQDKAGCLLLQLPPSLALDEATARRFFSLLRSATETPIVCEPRHATWFAEAGAALMKQAGIGCVRADPPPVVRAAPVGDPHVSYFRLHGSPQIYHSAYDAPFIEALAAQLTEAGRTGAEAWCIFDNTARGEAIPNALTLMATL